MHCNEIRWKLIVSVVYMLAVLQASVLAQGRFKMQNDYDDYLMSDDDITDIDRNLLRNKLGLRLIDEKSLQHLQQNPHFVDDNHSLRDVDERVSAIVGNCINEEFSKRLDKISNEQDDMDSSRLNNYEPAQVTMNAEKPIRGLYDSYRIRLDRNTLVSPQSQITSDSEFPVGDENESARDDRRHQIKTMELEDDKCKCLQRPKADQSHVANVRIKELGTPPAVTPTPSDTSQMKATNNTADKALKANMKQENVKLSEQHNSTSAATTPSTPLISTPQHSSISSLIGSTTTTATTTTTTPTPTYGLETAYAKLTVSTITTENIANAYPLYPGLQTKYGVPSKSLEPPSILFSSVESTTPASTLSSENTYMLDPYPGFRQSYIKDALNAFQKAPFFSLYDEYQRQLDKLNEMLKNKQRWWDEARSKGLAPKDFNDERIDEPAMPLQQNLNSKSVDSNYDYDNTVDIGRAGTDNIVEQDDRFFEDVPKNYNMYELDTPSQSNLHRRAADATDDGNGSPVAAEPMNPSYSEVLAKALEFSMSPPVPGKQQASVLVNVASKMNMTPLDLAQKLTQMVGNTDITNLKNDQNFSQLVRNYVDKTVGLNNNSTPSPNHMAAPKPARGLGGFSTSDTTVVDAQSNIAPILEKILAKLENMQQTKGNPCNSITECKNTQENPAEVDLAFY